MAEFCQACSIDLFNEDFGDFIWEGQPCLPEEGWSVVCEGCGFILVDNDGRCIKCDLMKGQPGHDGNI